MILKRLRSENNRLLPCNFEKLVFREIIAINCFGKRSLTPYFEKIGFVKRDKKFSRFTLQVVREY